MKDISYIVKLELPYARIACMRFLLEVVYIVWNMIWPILIVVAANTVYHICAKSTPANINSFATLSITYLIAMICSVIAYFVTSDGKNILQELSKANWTAFALGIAIIGLEFGNICIYRAGWKIGTANLFASVTLTCVLLIVGFLFYKEVLNLRQLLGMAVCIVGLVLILK